MNSSNHGTGRAVGQVRGSIDARASIKAYLNYPTGHKGYVANIYFTDLSALTLLNKSFVHEFSARTIDGRS